MDVLQWASDFFQSPDGTGTILGIVIPTALTLIWSGIKWVTRLIGFSRAKADLHPFYSLKAVRYASKYYIETRGLEMVSPHATSPDGNAFGKSGKLIPFFIKKAFKETEDDQRFYLILADPGMGKTTFLINLYLRYSNRLSRKQFKIDLMPLWHPKTWDRLLNYKEDDAKDTILLLDSLDEDPRAISDITVRLNELIDHVWNFRKVVICCSTQLFPDQKSEPSELKIPFAGSTTGFHSFYKIYLAPFNHLDIVAYINKRFSIFRWNKRKKAVELINKSSSLMERPLLLSYIDDLINTKKKYEYAYEVYDSLIEKWIEREATLLPAASREIFRKQLFVLSKDVAFKLFTKYKKTKEIFLTEQELKDLIDSRESVIDLSIFRTKSLITRNEGGLFKFAHSTIFDFFLAQVAIDPEYEFHEDDLKLFNNAHVFYQELLWNREVLPFFSGSGGHVFTRMNNKEVDITDILKNGGLEKVSNLFVTGLKNLSLVLLSPLKNMQSLQAIDTPILSYSSIKSLKQLRTLNFENCNISDVHPIRFLTDLNYLHLKNGRIKEIEPLSELTELQYLNLENNQIADLTPLRNLKKLRRLGLVNNKVNDLTPLAELDGLSWLFIAGNPVEDAQIDELRKLLPKCDIDRTKTSVHL